MAIFATGLTSFWWLKRVSFFYFAFTRKHISNHSRNLTIVTSRVEISTSNYITSCKIGTAVRRHRSDFRLIIYVFIFSRERPAQSKMKKQEISKFLFQNSEFDKWILRLFRFVFQLCFEWPKVDFLVLLVIPAQNGEFYLDRKCDQSLLSVSNVKQEVLQCCISPIDL